MMVARSSSERPNSGKSGVKNRGNWENSTRRPPIQRSSVEQDHATPARSPCLLGEANSAPKHPGAHETDSQVDLSARGAVLLADGHAIPTFTAAGVLHVPAQLLTAVMRRH